MIHLSVSPSSISISLHLLNIIFFLEPDDSLTFINEMYLQPYYGTFHDYAESVVQFGYVNLFSVVRRCLHNVVF